MNRLNLLLKLLGGLPKSKQKEFFRKMHEHRHTYKPHPKLRQKITHEDFYDPHLGGPSELDMLRVVSQQREEMMEYFLKQDLNQILGGGKEDEILEVFKGLMTPVVKNRRRHYRLPISDRQDYGQFRPRSGIDPDDIPGPF
tara:strand:+ start:1300 stop:1722 length:423 start_codon:yes stop_codon:yes gene_type:complete